VSADCSCWYDANGFFSRVLVEPAAMEQQMYDADHRLPVSLVMAGDATSNGAYVADVYDSLATHGYQGLRIVHNSYSVGHVPMDRPSFADALPFIAAGP